MIVQGLHSLAFGHTSQGIDGGTDRGVVLAIDFAQLPQSLGMPFNGIYKVKLYVSIRINQVGNYQQPIFSYNISVVQLA